MRTFDRPYRDWGKCEICSVAVPASGAMIGFFGKADRYPRWCRVCVARDGDPELLAEWDAAVGAERERRAKRG